HPGPGEERKGQGLGRRKGAVPWPLDGESGWECLHLWWGPWSSKPVEGLNKALCGFDSHTLPLLRLATKVASLSCFYYYVNQTRHLTPHNWLGCQKTCRILPCRCQKLRHDD